MTIHKKIRLIPFQLEGQSKTRREEYLFVAIDDYSREPYAGIFSDKTQYSSAKFLEQIIEECPHTIEEYMTDKGKE